MIEKIVEDVRLEKSTQENFGYHIFARFTGSDDKLLNNKNLLMKILKGAALYADMKSIGEIGKQFTPQGATVILGLEESHISIHTWPEKGVATLDVYTCGTKESCEKAYEMLKMRLKPKKIGNDDLIER